MSEEIIPAEVVEAADDVRQTAMSVPDGIADMVSVDTESQRAISETVAQYSLAQRFPRDLARTWANVLPVLRSPQFAKEAMYSYPRGSKMVTGPSIRLVEELARAYRNLSYGIVEVARDADSSIIQAFATDLEANIRVVRTFKVPHYRWTKNKGRKKAEDPRDIYEISANNGARRLRACLMQLLPKWLIEDAVGEVRRTIAGDTSVPIEERARKMVAAFKDLGVTQDMIEKRLGHALAALDSDELIELTGIYNALRDGTSRRADFFDVASSAPEAEDVTSRIVGEEEG